MRFVQRHIGPASADRTRRYLRRRDRFRINLTRAAGLLGSPRSTVSIIEDSAIYAGSVGGLWVKSALHQGTKPLPR